MRACLILTATMGFLSMPVLAGAPAQPPASNPAISAEATMPFVRADAEKAVGELATALEENFLFPDSGKAYAAALRANLAAGKYARFASAGAFAQQVTADLQGVHKDGHLRLEPMPAEMRAQRRAPNGGPPQVSAVAKAGWLAEGVAYIDFAGFPGNDSTLADVRKFIAGHRDARSLIIDARRNGGGGLAEMNLLFEQIFAKPATLVVMDIREAVEKKHGTPFGDDDKVLRKVAGPATIVRREHFVTPAAAQGALRDAKVYLLTSKKTFSAAEHLSLSLKRTGRATLIGEATGGGAHFGGMSPMG